MEKVKPEWVVATLKKYNQTVTLEQAQLIIDFMQMLAECEIDKILNNEDCEVIPPGGELRDS